MESISIPYEQFKRYAFETKTNIDGITRLQQINYTTFLPRYFCRYAVYTLVVLPKFVLYFEVEVNKSDCENND